MESCDAKATPVHLCVLVHGLWGNPSHLAYVAGALTHKHPDSSLHILVAARNAGNHTYDGIELGGERLTHEIEHEVETLAADGKTVARLSLVGYSLGGLVARYAIGLLYWRGSLDRMEPVNFTTFASPYLGARATRNGVLQTVFNVLGSRTLSMSGRQLFLTDTFRDTGRPLLTVLADPKSIFMRGLSRFKRRTLYANIINDRTAPYYTTFISRVDPYVDLGAVRINYAKGYDNVIVDPDHPVSALDTAPTGVKRLWIDGQSLVGKAPTVALLSLLLPVGLLAFLVHSGIQSIRSSRRIQLHEQGKAGIVPGSYRIPLMIDEVERAVDGVMRDPRPRRTSFVDHHGQPERSLSDDERDRDEAKPQPSNLSSASTRIDPSAPATPPATPPTEPPQEPPETPASSRISHNSRSSTSSVKGPFLSDGQLSRFDHISRDGEMPHDGETSFPTLPLSHEQLGMVRSLDALGFRKYGVHIHDARHSHAAIIVRTDRSSFVEGKVVVRHWLENEFDL